MSFVENKQVILNDNVKENNDNVKQASEDKVYEDTLEEPISDTFKRDLNKIYQKLKCVLIPNANTDSSKEIRDWDLWGPLLICTLLAMIIGFGGQKDKGLIFVVIFTVVWIGGIIITLNAQFLGSKVSFFQSICLLGYCVFPFTVFGFLIKITPFLPKLIHIIFSVCSFLWACYCKFII